MCYVFSRDNEGLVKARAFVYHIHIQLVAILGAVFRWKYCSRCASIRAVY